MKILINHKMRLPWGACLYTCSKNLSERQYAPLLIFTEKNMSFSRRLAHAIRFLSVDAVELAQSGHPGMPLGMADIATVLWKKFLRHNPKNPLWYNRDRFVLSNGHGSMLLYALLHLTGYALSLDELKHFRQLNSKTPGHPEKGHTPGVETTTGPLGQGLGNAVGMAIAEKIMASRFNQTQTLVDHYTYVFLGDGCLMEGISHEVASLAGTLGLGKLIAFYDDNGISIDGKVEPWFTDDTPMRFRAYHWHVIEGIDGHDMQAVEQAINLARAETDRPSLLCCKTVIGYGSNMAGSEKVHGAPLGASDIAHLRDYFDWPYPPFEIPQEIYHEWNHDAEGIADEDAWIQQCHDYQTQYPERYIEFIRQIQGDLPDDWLVKSNQFIAACQHQDKPLATRKASQHCLEAFGGMLPELLGGSADLSGSNLTNWSGSHAIERDNFTGNYLFYGVREFGMAAIMNGISVHGGLIPYGGTFLVFADYARNAIRLSALMNHRVIYVLTHDSIGLGEDGPTHQPIEHAAMLRMTPNVQVWRPADLLETAVAWQQAIMHRHGPTCLLLSRQNLPALNHSLNAASLIALGGYILYDASPIPDVILISTGSELHLAQAAAIQAQTLGVMVRVVSMPCAERFLAQDEDYQRSVLPPENRRRIAIEAAASGYWYRFVGLDGAVVGLDTFGASAHLKDIYDFFGITVDAIIKLILKFGEEL
jgi:transketolase